MFYVNIRQGKCKEMQIRSLVGFRVGLKAVKLPLTRSAIYPSLWERNLIVAGCAAYKTRVHPGPRLEGRKDHGFTPLPVLNKDFVLKQHPYQ
jgi:hypothetical protein